MSDPSRSLGPRQASGGNLFASPLTRQSSTSSFHSVASPRPGSPVNTAITFSVEEEVREREENGWEYSAYRIVTSTQGQSFVAIRRFKAFLGLHTALRVHIPTLPSSFPLWGNILNRFAPEVIEARKLGFQKYLTSAIAAFEGAPIPAVRHTRLSFFSRARRHRAAHRASLARLAIRCCASSSTCRRPTRHGAPPSSSLR